MKNKTLQNCSISYHFLFNDQTFIDKHSSVFFFLDLHKINCNYFQQYQNHFLFFENFNFLDITLGHVRLQIY